MQTSNPLILFPKRTTWNAMNDNAKSAMRDSVKTLLNTFEEFCYTYDVVAEDYLAHMFLSEGKIHVNYGLLTQGDLAFLDSNGIIEYYDSRDQFDRNYRFYETSAQEQYPSPNRFKVTDKVAYSVEYKKCIQKRIRAAANELIRRSGFVIVVCSGGQSDYFNSYSDLVYMGDNKIYIEYKWQDNSLRAWYSGANVSLPILKAILRGA